MYNSETPKVCTTTEIYSEDQNPPPSSNVSMTATLTHTYQSATTPGKSGESIPTVSTQTVENVPGSGSPYQPNPFGNSNQLCNCSNPKCTHRNKSSIKQHQSLNQPQPFQLPPPNTTHPNLQPDTQYPPTTPNNLSSNSHTTPPTTPNNLSSNSHTTTPTHPTPISTGKPQDGTPIPSHLYPTEDSGATGHYIMEQGLLDQLFLFPFNSFNNLPPNPLHLYPLQRQPLPLHPLHPINKHTNPFFSSNPFQKHVSRVDEGATNLMGNQKEVKNNKSDDGEQLMEHSQNPSTKIHDKPQGAENVQSKNEVLNISLAIQTGEKPGAVYRYFGPFSARPEKSIPH